VICWFDDGDLVAKRMCELCICVLAGTEVDDAISCRPDSCGR
jgi:hypothetical protein